MRAPVSDHDPYDLVLEAVAFRWGIEQSPPEFKNRLVDLMLRLRLEELRHLYNSTWADVELGGAPDPCCRCDQVRSRSSWPGSLPQWEGSLQGN